MLTTSLAFTGSISIELEGVEVTSAKVGPAFGVSLDFLTSEALCCATVRFLILDCVVESENKTRRVFQATFYLKPKLI